MQKQVSLFAAVVTLAVVHAAIAQPPPPPSWTLNTEGTTPVTDTTITANNTVSNPNYATGTATVSSAGNDPSAPHRATATSMVKTTFPAGAANVGGSFKASARYQRTFSWDYPGTPAAVYLIHNFEYEGDLTATVTNGGHAIPTVQYTVMAHE